MIWPGAAGEKLASRVASSIPTPSSSTVMRMPSGSRRTASEAPDLVRLFKDAVDDRVFNQRLQHDFDDPALVDRRLQRPPDRDPVLKPQVLDFHIKPRVLELVRQGDDFRPGSRESR